jgi:DNA transposition AAA+ family ATPase
MRKDVFVADLSNVVAFVEVISQVKEAAARRNPSVGIISAPYGIGKTETCLWFYTRNKNTVYISVKAAMSTRDFFEELLLEIGGTPRGNLYKIFAEIVETLRQKEEPPVILLDEANRLAEKKKMIEILRDLHDEAHVPIVLVGSPEFLPVIRKFGAFHSRIRVMKTLSPLSIKDIQKIASACLENCRLDPGAAKTLRAETGGNTRQVVIALEALERYAKANAKEVITSEDVRKIMIKARKAFEEA